MYAIPIIQSLQSRFIPRIRALIIVPTRDLVKQVKQTFLSLADKTNLKIVTLSGGKPFVVEQQKLVHPLNNGYLFILFIFFIIYFIYYYYL